VLRILADIQLGLGGFLSWRPSAAKLGGKRLSCRIGLDIELAFEQRNEALVVREHLGLASSGGERPHNHPMGVLADAVERDRPPARLQSLPGAAIGQLLLCELQQVAKGEVQEPPALAGQPFVPALFVDDHVID
jgi:hypothetical protein